ncbi:FAD-binding oxidoreductase [Lewinella sp. W8]|uniref:NAD(P)/FAD-dependent oxidoreductase n=1 Tax=Lewinella sp. W8 TaxID=2528208 RepID=UPI00106739E6|nr:FAD-dependent oxidoreductase [Lewinella sp. W8]MTB51475.1 FAD-dependent oxidoreductase [Lewinella sp. W8]
MPYATSYWEQTSFLRPADVIIVGAGLTGLQAALELKRREPDCDVLVVERSSLPLGASTRNAGFSCFGSPTELLADWDAHGRESMLETVAARFAGIRALEDNFSGQRIDWENHGGFEVLEPGGAAEEVRARIHDLNAALAPITGVEATWLPIPNDNTGFARETSLYVNHFEAQLHPGKLVERLLDSVQRAGVRCLFGCEVTEVHADDGAAYVQTAAMGAFRTERVLVTVNAFTARLLPEVFGEHIRPVRNQVMISQPLPVQPLRGCYHFHEGYVYFRNVGMDRILIGGGRHLAGATSETDQFGPNEAVVDYLLTKLNAWLPDLHLTSADFPVRWSGILAQGSAKTPIVQFTHERILVAGRLAGMGVALSAALAQRAVDTLQKKSYPRDMG